MISCMSLADRPFILGRIPANLQGFGHGCGLQCLSHVLESTKADTKLQTEAGTLSIRETCNAELG